MQPPSAGVPLTLPWLSVMPAGQGIRGGMVEHATGVVAIDGQQRGAGTLDRQGVDIDMDFSARQHDRAAGERARSCPPCRHSPRIQHGVTQGSGTAVVRATGHGYGRGRRRSRQHQADRSRQCRRQRQQAWFARGRVHEGSSACRCRRITTKECSCARKRTACPAILSTSAAKAVGKNPVEHPGRRDLAGVAIRFSRCSDETGQWQCTLRQRQRDRSRQSGARRWIRIADQERAAAFVDVDIEIDAQRIGCVRHIVSTRYVTVS